MSSVYFSLTAVDVIDKVSVMERQLDSLSDRALQERVDGLQYQARRPAACELLKQTFILPVDSSTGNFSEESSKIKLLYTFMRPLHLCTPHN